MHAPFEGYVETGKGPAFVRIRGEGPRLVVFHGGPGFDQEPLLDSLAGLQKHRTLVFFDQLGCGRTVAATEPVTAEATIAHAAALLDALGNEPVGAVAHSWGTVLAAAVATLRPELGYREAMLISPVAFDNVGYDDARAAAARRVPAEALERMWAMLSEGRTGTEAFAEISRYYAASPDATLPPIPVAAPVFVSVDATLGTFDYWPAVERMGQITVVRGANDYVATATIRPLLDHAADDIVMPDVGHYPFFEDPPGFAAAIEPIFG